ncbi:alpha/beta hydrolase family protein [Sphingomonas sp. YL-JM2C]
MNDYTRTPYLVVRKETHRRRDVYGSVGDTVALTAQLLRGSRPSKTAIVAMHPIGSPGYLPMFAGLAREGHHIFACGTRYISGDAPLQMENLLLDMAACVTDVREKYGYEKVLLAGWSGGGSLMVGYQAEAEKRAISMTAAGEETLLTETALPKADGVVLMAPHRSRHHLLTGFLDPAIVDETDPDKRDPEFDLYGPGAPKPPYSADFIAAYRAAQRRRSDAITDRAQQWLEKYRDNGGDGDNERCFVVYGTMADPRWLDATIDPNDRVPGSCYLGDPKLVNNAPSGLARFTTARSWLSQWSARTAQIDAVDCASRVTVPVMIMENTADNACPTPHIQLLHEAMRHNGAELHRIVGADHYFTGEGQRSHLAEALQRVTAWTQKHGFFE